MIRAYVEAIEELTTYREAFRALADEYGEQLTHADPLAGQWIRGAMRYAYDRAHEDIHAGLYLLILSIFLTATLTNEANGEKWQP